MFDEVTVTLSSSSVLSKIASADLVFVCAERLLSHQLFISKPQHMFYNMFI